jgi:hypothetical protein
MYVIANERAGRGRGGLALAAVRPLLPAEAEIAVTTGAGDARALAAKAAAGGERLIGAGETEPKRGRERHRGFRIQRGVGNHSRGAAMISRGHSISRRNPARPRR